MTCRNQAGCPAAVLPFLSRQIPRQVSRRRYTGKPFSSRNLNEKCRRLRRLSVPQLFGRSGASFLADTWKRQRPASVRSQQLRRSSESGVAHLPFSGAAELPRRSPAGSSRRASAICCYLCREGAAEPRRYDIQERRRHRDLSRRALRRTRETICPTSRTRHPNSMAMALETSPAITRSISLRSRLPVR